jgi:hypothetical protein
MARYASYFLLRPQRPSISELVSELLTQCGLTITYNTEDYVMAQELAGRLPYNQLVKVEVLIHKSDMQKGVVKLTCVCKNGELQLQSDNHCQRLSDQLVSAFRECSLWQFIEQLNE